MSPELSRWFLFDGGQEHDLSIVVGRYPSARGAPRKADRLSNSVRPCSCRRSWSWMWRRWILVVCLHLPQRARGLGVGRLRRQPPTWRVGRRDLKSSAISRFLADCATRALPCLDAAVRELRMAGEASTDRRFG